MRTLAFIIEVHRVLSHDSVSDCMAMLDTPQPMLMRWYLYESFPTCRINRSTYSPARHHWATTAPSLFGPYILGP